ncbi:MAG: sulfatase-like hydrolase/transferase [Planctomycetota bacterium]
MAAPRLLSIALLVLAASCGGGGEERPRSALLITMDTTRADALSCYGAPPGVTPHLDALAAEGVLYEEARTTAPVTMPSHASMLTGLYPLRHTVRTNSQAALPASALTLAEAARDAGLSTAAFVAAVVLADDFGLAQGFDTYDQPERPAVQTEAHYESRDAEDVVSAALAWLDARDPDEPFFAWVHFFDPHLPYDPPADLVEQAGGNPYHAEVARMDRAIGRLLDALRAKGRLDDTLVLAVADHGEALEQHGEGTHGCLVYDPVIRVPMIVRDAGDPRAGTRSDEIVSVTDVYPTVAEALGLPAAADVDGRSLFRRTVPDDRGVYFESYYGFFSFGWSQLAGWADRRGKTIVSSRPEFYVVRDDPGELDDRIAAHAPIVEQHRERIAKLAAAPSLERTADDRATQAVEDQLRALGYTGAGGGDEDPLHPLAPSTRPSPSDRIASHRAYLRSITLHFAGQSAEAATLLEEIVRENGLHHLAWSQLSTCYVALKRYEEAITAAHRSLEIGQEWYGPHENLGVSYDNLERYPEAVEQYKRVLALRPGHREIRDRLVLLLRYLKREDEAKRYAAEAP